LKTFKVTAEALAPYVAKYTIFAKFENREGGQKSAFGEEKELFRRVPDEHWNFAGFLGFFRETYLKFLCRFSILKKSRN